MSTLLAFAGTTFLLAMLPGVGQAVMTQQVLTYGRRPALMSSLGTGAGLVLWSVAAAVGLSSLLRANPDALTAVRYGGGLILVALGLRTVLRRQHHPAPAPLEPSQAPSSLGSFMAGLATNLGNPKAGIFAAVLLPQFVPAGSDPLWTTTGLGLVWATVTVAWYALFTWLVDRGQHLLTNPKAHRRLAITSGAALISVGVSVAIGL
jgi:threonine/homoserine/homoserine lactone efflux protein